MEDHMESDKVWEAYIFCKKHKVEGVSALQQFGLQGIKGTITDKKTAKK